MKIEIEIFYRIISLILGGQFIIEILKYFLYKKRNNIEDEIKLSQAYSKLLREQTEKIRNLEKQVQDMNDKMFAYLENSNLLLKEKQGLEQKMQVMANEIKLLQKDKSLHEKRESELELKISELIHQIEKK